MSAAELIPVFLQNLGVVAVAAVVHEAALQHLKHRQLRSLATTLIITLGAVGSMAVPVEITPGLLFDLRNVFLVLAAACGGWPAAAVAAVAAGAFRLWQGGIGAVPGAGAIVIVALVGIGFARIWPLYRLTIPKLALMGFASTSSLVALFLLPWNTAMGILETMAFPMMIGNTIGVVVTGLILSHQRNRLREVETLAQRASLDPLTGLANRRIFDEEGPRVARTMAEADQACSVLVIDVDNFKALNDTFGHAAGDRVLKEIAEEIVANTLPSDLVARYGGEEFAVVLPYCNATNAQLVADRIRRSVESNTIDLRGLKLKVTVSIGVHGVEEREESFPESFDRADNALYRAKTEGKNRVEIATAA